jgi:broad specificity phosphatase PhoE
MRQPAYLKILNHPDRDEIISKLTIGSPPKDIHDWLAAKYSAISEKQLVISEKALKVFKDNYLDFYQTVQNDILNTRSTAMVPTRETDELSLAVQNSPQYQELIKKAANAELDFRQLIVRVGMALETRLAQIFDAIQEDPRNINTRIDRVFLDYCERMESVLDKCHKFNEPQANTVVQHNMTIQVVDQHIAVFHDVIRKVLSQMDVESSLLFLEIFNEEFSKLKIAPDKDRPTAEMKIAEATLIHEEIGKKLN